MDAISQRPTIQFFGLALDVGLLRNEIIVVHVLEGTCRQRDREPKLIQPFRDSTVNGNLEAGKAQPVQQVP